MNTVHGKAGKQQGKDQGHLTPVPEAFETFVNLNVMYGH
jgi:hypothetical protein